jgi:hypothetical protein
VIHFASSEQFEGLMQALHLQATEDD